MHYIGVFSNFTKTQIDEINAYYFKKIASSMDVDVLELASHLNFTGSLSLNKDSYSFLNGVLHSYNNQPAIIKNYGVRVWYREGKLHSFNDQPALIYANGSKEWYKEGKLHRDNDLPAIILIDGTKFWYQEGSFLHKEESLQ